MTIIPVRDLSAGRHFPARIRCALPVTFVLPLVVAACAPETPEGCADSDVPRLTWSPEAITVPAGGVNVVVQATDPTESGLTFTWLLSSSGALPSTELDGASQVALDYDTALDGQTLIVDVSNECGVAEASWGLTVEE